MKLQSRNFLMPSEWAVSESVYHQLLWLYLGLFALGVLKRDTFRVFGRLGLCRRTLRGTPAPAGPTVELTCRYRWVMEPLLKL